MDIFTIITKNRIYERTSWVLNCLAVLRVHQHIILYIKTVCREPVHSFQRSFAEQHMMRTIKDKGKASKAWLNTFGAHTNMSANTHRRRRPISTERASYLSGDDKWVEIRWKLCDATCRPGRNDVISKWQILSFTLFLWTIPSFSLQDQIWNMMGGGKQGKVMTMKGHDIILCFNQFFSHTWVKDRVGVKRLWMSKSQGILVIVWYDLLVTGMLRG